MQIFELNWTMIARQTTILKDDFWQRIQQFYKQFSKQCSFVQFKLNCILWDKRLVRIGLILLHAFVYKYIIVHWLTWLSKSTSFTYEHTTVLFLFELHTHITHIRSIYSRSIIVPYTCPKQDSIHHSPRPSVLITNWRLNKPSHHGWIIWDSKV